MQPVYFLPNVGDTQVNDATKENGLNRRLLQEHGLLGIFGDLRGKDLSISNGRVKAIGEGCLLAYGAPDKFTRPDSLEWQEGPVWIGFDPENLPTEKELQRKRLVNGYYIETETGEKWQVPIIRRPDDTTELPCDMWYDAGGVLKEPVKEAYREFWDATAEVVGLFHDDSSPPFSRMKSFDFAVKALGINYRFGHAEQRVCKVVTSENFMSILCYTIDVPRFMAVTEAKKKNSLPPTPNTTPGQEGSSPAIDPAEQTSI